MNRQKNSALRALWKCVVVSVTGLLPLVAGAQLNRSRPQAPAPAPSAPRSSPSSGPSSSPSRPTRISEPSSPSDTPSQSGVTIGTGVALGRSRPNSLPAPSLSSDSRRQTAAGALLFNPLTPVGIPILSTLPQKGVSSSGLSSYDRFVRSAEGYASRHSYVVLYPVYQYDPYYSYPDGYYPGGYYPAPSPPQEPGRSARPADRALLKAAIADITNAWLHGDIGLLAKHVRRDTRISITLGGRYQYALRAGDYLDATRNALRLMHTISLDLKAVHRDNAGLYTASGLHVYTDESGQMQRVRVSYTLQWEDDNYYIVRIDSRPEGAN